MVFYIAVFHIKWISGGGGAVNQLSFGLFVVESHLNPGIFKSAGDLINQPMDGFQSTSEIAMNTKFNGITETQVGDPDLRPLLSNLLNPTFALF